jgi:hypothetical protein
MREAHRPGARGYQLGSLGGSALVVAGAGGGGFAPAGIGIFSVVCAILPPFAMYKRSGWHAGGGPVDEDMRDGQCGGQSRKQVFNTEITEKDKATEDTERIRLKIFRDD